MRIAITGSNGFVGSALVSWFDKHQYQLTRLIRETSNRDFRHSTITWDPLKRTIDVAKLENHDVIIHLAGENVANGRWTKTKKKSMWDSRVKGTAFLAETISKLQHPPKLFLCASAYGYYGSHNFPAPEKYERLTEESPPGEGFLASLSQAWEEATTPAKIPGIRVVSMRIGLVLGLTGGALSKMLPVFKLGLGGKIGNGHQMMPWIVIDEFPRIIHHIMKHEELSGPINVTAPNPISNAAFTKMLGKSLRRPTFFPLPAFIAKLMMGEMAEELLLSGLCVLPRKLQESGYHFLYPSLEAAFRHLLSQPH